MNNPRDKRFSIERRRLLQGLTGGAVLMVLPGAVRPLAAADGAFRVEIEPLEASYRVGEPIRFRVRGNRPFFLYLYSLDEGGGNATLILPNRKQPGNHYQGNRSYILPGRTVDFVADKPGVEHLVLIASEDDLGVDPGPFRPEGDFALATPQELERLFGGKGIRLRDNQPFAEGGSLVVREFDIPVEGASWGLEPVNDPVVFLSTAKSRYRPGEQLNILFGADRSGWIHLYATEPGGSFDLLTRRQVEAGHTERVQARVEAPYGRHLLIAVLAPDETIDEEMIANIAEDPGRAVDESKAGYSIDVKTIQVSY